MKPIKRAEYKLENTYKYNAELSGFPDCPPKDLFDVNLEIAYRWVFEDITHSNNFLPINLIPTIPPRTPSCGGLAISLYDTLVNAETEFLRFYKKNKRFMERVGNCIAKVKLNENQGKVSPIKENGHFNLFEYSGCNLQNQVEDIYKIKIP